MYHGYDVRGLLTHARFTSDSSPGVTNTYDGFGWLRTSSSNMGGTARTVESDYDAHGNRTQIEHPDGKTFEYEFDTADRLFRLFENGTSTRLALIAYDEQRLPDAIERDAAGAITGYDFDPIARLEVLTHNLDGLGTANDAGFGFAYNPASQITTRAQINDAYEFALSNSVKSYVTNGRNQYTQVGGTTHTWDANGNLTDDGPTTFDYDTENRLVSAGGAALKYDPLGRLYEVSIPAGSTTRFVYDGDRLIAEYNNSGTLLRRYVHGAGVDEPLVWYEGAAVGAGNRSYLHADHQGSIVAVSNASGVMQQVHAYDSYGVTDAGNTGRFQYTGQAAIPELGLLYYKARFYNPSLGRFMQTDPIGYNDDLNLYAYVRNDPLSNIDPTGTDCISNEKAGSTTCDVNVTGSRIPRTVTFTTPEGWSDFKTNDLTTHTYDQEEEAGEGDGEYKEGLQDGLNDSPTPGQGKATPEGNTIDVDVSGPWGEDNVTSYAAKTESGEPYVVNVTTRNHTLHSGFVFRMVVSDGRGGFKIVTHGEGNAWKQLFPGAESAAIRLWEENSQKIIAGAR